jgi:hypothetical protein
MGNKPWRTLSVFLALGAFTVGCTNGPQKSTGFGANTQPTGKSTQMASQQHQQSFPLAGGQQGAGLQQNSGFNSSQQKQPGLPQINPPGNQFNQTTGNPTTNQPNPFAPTGGLGNQSQLEQFQPIQPIQKTGSQSFPPGGGMTPIGGGPNNPSNPVAPNTGFGSDRGPQPINLNQPR